MSSLQYDRFHFGGVTEHTVSPHPLLNTDKRHHNQDQLIKMISPGQYYTMVLVGMFSSALSAICSGAVVVASLKGLKNGRSVYQTLILALSTSDLVGSFTTIFHPFLMPRRTREDGMLWASGNDATCSLAGFFLVSCYPLVSFFSLYLSAYFLAKVRYNAQDRVLAKYFMWPGIVVALLLCGTLAVVGSATKSFAPRVYHDICSFGDCEMGKLDECPFESGFSWYLGWAQVALIALPALVALGFTISVYVTVRDRLNKGRRYVFGSNQQQQNYQRDKILAVRSQALWYSFAYWNSFFWYFVYGVIGGDDYLMIEKEGEPFYFAMSVLVWFFFPLQGVVNFAVYTRPRYLQWRQSNNASRCFALGKAISFQPVSATQHVRATPPTVQEQTSKSFHQRLSSKLVPAFRSLTFRKETATDSAPRPPECSDEMDPTEGETHTHHRGDPVIITKAAAVNPAGDVEADTNEEEEDMDPTEGETHSNHRVDPVMIAEAATLNPPGDVEDDTNTEEKEEEE